MIAKKGMPPSVVTILAMAVLLGCLSSCADRDSNTRVSAKLTPANFASLRVGMSKDEVDQVIGPEFALYTKMSFRNGSSNNYPGIRKPDQTTNSLSYFAYYSAPRNRKVDYKVYSVSYDTEWRVIAKETFYTD